MKKFTFEERKNADGKTFYFRFEINAERGYFSVRTGAVKMIFGNWREVYTGLNNTQITKRYFKKLSAFLNVADRDLFGVPSYAVENGIYNYKTEGAAYVAARYNMTEAEAVQIYGANDPNFAVYQLEKLGITGRWASAANKAYKLYEELTGTKLNIDFTAVRSNIKPLTITEAEEIKNKIAAGYYTAAAIDQRAAEAEENRKKEEREKIIKEYTEKIENAQNESKIMLLMFDTFGTVDNIIYYSHSKTVGFNWKSYGGQKWEAEQITRAAEVLTAAGVNVAIENKQK